jgi:hypothetical protein
MFAYNTLCVSVPPTETSRQAVAWREVSGCHFHRKESLDERNKKQEYLPWPYTCERFQRAVKARFLYILFPLACFPLASIAANVGICCHAAKVLAGFHGQSGSCLRFCKKSSSFPYGRAYLFAKNLTTLNPASLIADETKSPPRPTTHIKKVNMMKNSKHITKEKLTRFSKLHIAWVGAKWLMLIGLLLALVWIVVNSGAGIFLAATVFFLLIRSLVRLTFRLMVTIVYIILLLSILGLIIL